MRRLIIMRHRKLSDIAMTAVKAINYPITTAVKIKEQHIADSKQQGGGHGFQLTIGKASIWRMP